VNNYLVIFVTRMFFATKQSRILVFHKCAQMRRTKRSGRTLDCCTKYRYLACYLNRPKWHQKVIIRRRRVDYWYAAAEPLFSRIRFHRFRIVQSLTRKKAREHKRWLDTVNLTQTPSIAIQRCGKSIRGYAKQKWKQEGLRISNREKLMQTGD
jgi:hypothetical protein